MKRRKTLIPILPAVVVLMFLSVVSMARAGDTIVVIVNNANPADNLKLGDLKKLFMSERSRWDTGKAVAPVMVGAGAPERTAFLKIVCGMNDADFNKYFVTAAFTAGSPGAIGFVRASEFSSGDSSIKALKIEGSATGDTTYKLKM